MENVSQIETPFLKAPFESLRRAAKERKSLVDDTTRLFTNLTSLADNEEDLTPEKASEQLDSVISKLTSLKRKLEDVSLMEKSSAEKFQMRMKCLVEQGEPIEDHVVQWNEQRMDRILIDYFLRNGYRDSASKLIELTDSEELVDAQIFRNAYDVIDGLKKRSCDEALAWCVENRNRLKRIKSKLEFKLHVQVFIELVRKNAMFDAIAYARQNLAPLANQSLTEFQRAIATIAFKPGTKCERYQSFFHEDRWGMMLEQFYDALFKLNSLTSKSLLDIHLQAGLSALKTHHSFEPDCCAEDPLHLSAFQKLAEELPFAKYDRSKLICSVTKEVMDADNPPNALPNGYVYSKKAVDQLTDVHGKITCPCTGTEFDASEVRRVYIV